jgi:membrane protease YdiL (CAAX protease family)
MYPINKVKLLTLTLEALGVFTLFIIFSIYVDAFLSRSLGLPGVILFWLLYGFFGAAVAYVVRRIKGNWTWRDLGFRVHRSWKKDIWLGFVIFALFYLIEIPFHIILIPSTSAQLSQQVSFLREMSLPIALLAITGIALLIGFITGSFHEEIRYRGYLQGLFSKEMAPALGLFISLIPFSLGHYFSHPDWNLVQVLNTLPMGVALCLGYYVSGSLLIPMTTHTLANWVPVYAPFLHSRGHIQSSYLIVFILGVLFVLICILGRRELRELRLKTVELFVKSGLKVSLLGVLVGFLFLAVIEGLRLVRFQMDGSAYVLMLGAFAALCLGLSFLKSNQKQST